MTSCQRIYGEIAFLVFGRNNFSLTPRSINYNAAVGHYPHSNSDLWLSHMRSQTKQLVRLKVFLNCPRELDIEAIAAGLAEFGSIEVEVTSLRSMSVPTRMKEEPLLGKLCKTIAKMRKLSDRTTWHDSGDIENAALFRKHLPAGFQTPGLTQYHILEDEEAWH